MHSGTMSVGCTIEQTSTLLTQISSSLQAKPFDGTLRLIRVSMHFSQAESLLDDCSVALRGAATMQYGRNGGYKEAPRCDLKLRDLKILLIDSSGTVEREPGKWSFGRRPTSGQALDPKAASFTPWRLTRQPPTTLYAGTYGGGVFKSTNGGANWSAVNTGLTNTYVHALAIDPANAEHALCRDIWRRRVQEHERRRDLERGQHRPDRLPMFTPWRLTRRPRARSMRGQMAAACSRARTAARTGARSTPA